MSWLVQPRLVNGPFDDPGLFLDFRFGRRAILFDLGDLTPLSARELLRISHVFVSHTHMDHFAGFDRLLRVCLHRDGPLHLLGPVGFIDRVEHRLKSYTWNLLDAGSVDCRVLVAEFSHGELATAAFHAREAFRREATGTVRVDGGRVLDEEQFFIEAAILDHGTPSLAFALRERMRVNVWRDALDKLGLPIGPWLNEAKRAVRLGLPDDTSIAVSTGLDIRLGELKQHAFRVGPGQVLAYVVDCGFSAGNIGKIVGLARSADQLFIESVFLEEDAELAERHRHLTAAQAGHLARMAGARHVTPLHFSARYLERPEALRQEVIDGFAGPAAVMVEKQDA